MQGDLAKYTEVRTGMALTRRTAKELNHIDEQFIVQSAGMAATASLRRDRIRQEAAVVAEVVDQGYDLGEHVVMRMAALSQLITASSHDNPGLELSMRAIGELLGLAAAGEIRKVMRSR